MYIFLNNIHSSIQSTVVYYQIKWYEVIYIHITSNDWCIYEAAPFIVNWIYQEEKDMEFNLDTDDVKVLADIVLREMESKHNAERTVLMEV